jgi:hypothetical protein
MISKLVSLVSFFVACFFLFAACTAKEKKEKAVDYEVYVDQVIHQFSKEMKKEYGFRCIGDGGRMPHDVEGISVDFMSYQMVSIDEARKLEVFAIETLLRIINTHEKIRPFLREFPFKATRTRVSISFHQKDNTYFTNGSVAFVFQAKDKIYYDKTEAHSQDLVDLYEEPYETALKIVNESTKKGENLEK